MKFRIYILIILFISQSSFCQVADTPEITSAELQSHINYLASDELKGRGSGTDECYTSAKYIENEFIKSGLKPLFDDSYLQEFPFIASIKMTENNSLKISAGEKIFAPELNKEFITVPFSGKVNVTGELVFAGFGISAPDLEYDDYADINVEGKIVVVLRNSPEPNVPHSKFDSHSSLRKKAAVARDKGAAGIIFVNGYEEFKKEDDLVSFEYDLGGSIADFGAVNVKMFTIEELFRSANRNFEDHYKKIVDEKKPASFIFENYTATLSTEVVEVEKLSWNVVGYLEGNEPGLKNEFVVIGAHFDHLGMGGSGSLDMSGTPQIHNGADDNASGTSGVLELVEKFNSEKDNLKRSVILVAFSGEELGLLGSNYFVNNMPYTPEKIISMINMDMIGRLKDSSLIVYGTGTSSNFKEILNTNNTYDFKLTFNDDGFGPSDHSSFYGKKIPVLFFFTGTHEDYHKPSDDAEKINSPETEKIVKYVYDVALNIINDDARPDYILVERKDAGPMPGRKVWVGTVPDFASDVDGYKISGVSDGSPAQLAGLQGGDIIIQFGEKKISNLYDFTYAIADYVPGDIVSVIVKRGEEDLTFEIKLASR